MNGSDLRIKKEVEIIPDALTKMRQIKGCTWRLKVNNNFGIGFIAQDVENAFPEAVTVSTPMLVPHTF
ncbi:TPA: tail fiber domain-containing protein [Escherichia coli]